MRNYSIILWVAILLNDANIAESQIAYEIITNTPGLEDCFTTIALDSLGNAYVGYMHELTDAEIRKTYLFKIDFSGDTVRYDFQSPDSLYGYSPYIDSDGNIILNGFIFPYDSTGNYDPNYAQIIKLNLDLEILWRRIYHVESDPVYAYGMEFGETERNSYVYVTFLNEINTNIWKLSTLELSKEGDSINYKSIYNPEHIGFPYSITSSPYDTSVVEYHIVMDLTPPWGDSAACGRIVLDDALNVIEQSAYPIRHLTAPFFTMRLYGSNFICAGRFGMGSDYIQLRVMDDSLNIIDSTSLCYSDNETVSAWIKCLDFIEPNRIFVAGITPYYSDYMENYIYVACLDANLNLIHEEFLGGDGHYDIYSIAATPDGGVILAGTYIDVSEIPLQTDAYLLKLDSSLFVGIDESILHSEKLSLKITPNPVQNLLNINSSLENYIFEIYDMNGKLCYHQVIDNAKEQINIENLSPGPYLWKASIGTTLNSGKLILF